MVPRPSTILEDILFGKPFPFAPVFLSDSGSAAPPLAPRHPLGPLPPGLLRHRGRPERALRGRCLSVGGHGFPGRGDRAGSRAPAARRRLHGTTAPGGDLAVRPLSG